MKQFIISPDSCIEDLIKGLLYTNPHLTKVKDANALVRRDIMDIRDTQVTLLSGGGSGHEPAHAGYIGDGMLSCAVLGHIFASPSVHSILASIRVTAGKAGILLIVKNYTGDRLNFGMALEQARQEGINGHMLIVDDDCALPPGKGITGGRGIAGTVLVHKLLGAMAKEGRSLADLVSYGICHLPGKSYRPEEDRLAAAGSMEIGLGIHGEPGRSTAFLPGRSGGEDGEEGKEGMGAARFVAKILVDAILPRLGLGAVSHPVQDPASSSTTSSSHPPLVLLINNLGTLPMLELMIMVEAIVSYVSDKGCGYSIARIFVGSFMTSLDMNGLSLTILDTSVTSSASSSSSSIDLLSLLDQSTTAPAWLSALPLTRDDLLGVDQRVIAAVPSINNNNSSTVDSNQRPSSAGVKISWRVACRLAQAVCHAIILHEPQLSDYDMICGDGDCGMVLKKGATRVLAVLQEKGKEAEQGVDEEVQGSVFCTLLAGAISESMGGTSGALLEICFRAMATSFRSTATATVAVEKEHHADVAAWIAAFAAGVQAIQYYGGGSQGMRTMLDALLPAVESMQQAVKEGKEGGGIMVEELLKRVAQAAFDGMEATKTMKSLAGRSNYVQEEQMQGIPDPGAYAVAMAFQAMAEESRKKE